MVKKIIAGVAMVLVSTISHGVYLTFKRDSKDNNYLYHIIRTYRGEQGEHTQTKTETTKMTSDIKKALKLEFDEEDTIEIAAYVKAHPLEDEGTFEKVGIKFQVTPALNNAVFVLSEKGYEVTKE